MKGQKRDNREGEEVTECGGVDLKWTQTKGRKEGGSLVLEGEIRSQKQSIQDDRKFIE